VIGIVLNIAAGRAESLFKGSVMSKIVVVGSSNTDMVIQCERLPAPGETILGGAFFMNPGGKGANQAVAAARLGGEVVFIAKVGDDIFGKEAVAGFKKKGINTDFIRVDTHLPSGIATIMVDGKGENCIAVASGANNALNAKNVDRAMAQVDEASVLLMQLETPMETIGYVTSLGYEKGKLVILNPAPARALSDALLAKVDVITPNETEAERLTGIKIETLDDAKAASAVLRKKGVGTVVITLGSQGAFVDSESFSGLVPVRKVKVIDTTAAGDTFNGALAVGIAGGMEIEEAVSFANEAAAISVTRLGAQASAPALEELKGFGEKLEKTSTEIVSL
jgi:ribokinase